MSLKAKLEAIVYAAEEPVTLAQMSLLFAEEALAWKAEQNAPTEGVPEPTLELVAMEPEPELLGEEASVPEGSGPEAEALEVSAEEAARAGGGEAEAAADAEQEARRLARLREREVREVLRGLLEELMAESARPDRGIEIREIAGGYRMATKPECHDAVRSFVKSLKPPLKLSLPALETLAVIAYKQPVTAPEVADIRGVDSAGVLGSLMSRKLIATAGRKPVVGRPMLYKTTREFLLRFGLKDVSELPSMEEFEKLAAVELSEELDSAGEGEAAGSGELFPEESAAQDQDDETRASAASATETGATTPSDQPNHDAAEAHAAADSRQEDGQDAIEIEAKV
jgi:segregation and condensation protein B